MPKKAQWTASALALALSPVFAQQMDVVAANAKASPSLAPIKVYASRFEEDLADSSPRLSVITSEEIQKSGASNVSEVLSRIGGLPTRVNLDGSTNALIDVRGYGDTAYNNVVILLDGVRLSENEQAAARTSMIPLEAISHIEIIRGGNSVLYGDGATGGTINIITKRNIGNLSVISAGVASYSGSQSSVYHSTTTGKNELSLFARHYASDNYRQNSDGVERSAGANWIRHIDPKSYLGARVFISSEKNKLPGSLPLLWLNTSPRQTQVPGYNWDANVESSSLTLFGRSVINNVELEIDLNQRSRSNSDAYRYDAYEVFSGYRYPDWRTSYSDSSSKTESKSVSPRIRVREFIFSNNVFQLGYDWRRSEKDGQSFLTFGCSSSGSTCGKPISDLTGNSDYRIVHETRSWYMRNTLELADRSRVIAGYRVEDFSQSRTIDYGFGPSALRANGNISAGELEYSRNLKQNLIGYFRLGKNFRIPNADDNSLAYASPGNILRTQKSDDIDTGVSFRSQRIVTELSYFRSRIRDEIGFDPNGCGYACNVNYDPSRRDGFHLSQEWTITPSLVFRANVHWINARFVRGPYSGKDIPGVSPLVGRVSLNYVLDAQQQVTFTTRFSDAGFMSGDFLNDQAKVPGYAVADLSYYYKEKNWSWLLSMTNIANKQYSDTGIYKPTYLDPYRLTVYPNPGRSFSVTGRYVF